MVAASLASLLPEEPLQGSKLFDFIVRKGHGVKGLADTDLKALPPCYVHPPEERIRKEETIDSSPYLAPPIDLCGGDPAEVEAAICGAAEKLGFFQVVNHGVPLEVLARAKEAAHRFFNLLPGKKAAYLKGSTPWPNVFYGTSFSPENEDSLEWKDYLSMIYMNDEEALTHWPPACRDEALEYLRSARKMTRTILGTLLRGLGVEVADSTLSSFTEANAVNMNYYPPCPSPELTVGVGRHSDLAALTILLQDGIGGLYVKVEGKGWIEIPPVEGALVINVGDTLEILSNGRYKSAEHRVLASSTKARVSVPIFVSPRPPTMIGPLLGLPEKHGKRVYRHLLFGEYMANFFAAGHRGKRTLDFAKTPTEA